MKKVFDAIHEADPDPKLLAYQYLQALPQIAAGDANKGLGGSRGTDAGPGELLFGLHTASAGRQTRGLRPRGLRPDGRTQLHRSGALITWWKPLSPMSCMFRTDSGHGCRVEQRARRLEHHDGSLLAAEAGDVDQPPSDSIPVAERIAMASRRRSTSGCSRFSGSRASRYQAIARPPRSGGRSPSGSKDSRSDAAAAAPTRW